MVVIADIGTCKLSFDLLSRLYSIESINMCGGNYDNIYVAFVV